MEDYVVKISVVGVFLWAVTFIFIRKILFPSHSFEFSSRIVSAIHATLTVILASLSVQDWNCPVCPYASQSSPRQMQTLAVTVSYLIYDLVCGYCDKRFNLDNTIHHFVSIVGLGTGLAYQKAMALGLQLVSAFWFYRIVRMVQCKLGLSGWFNANCINGPLPPK